MGYDASDPRYYTTLLGWSNNGTPAFIFLPVSSRLRGTYLIGKNGTGKTTLMLNMILSDVLNGRGVCVLDPHGKLIDDIIASTPQERCKDIVPLDLRASQTPFGLNLFECSDPTDPIVTAETTGQVVQVFKKIWGDLSWGPLLEDLLANIAHTMIENPGYTLAEVPRLLTDDAFRAELVGNVQNPVVRDFWRYEYDPMSDREQRENRRSTLNKVRDFIRSPLVRNIVGQSETTVDFDEILNDDKILLIKLDSQLEDATTLLGSTMVQQLLNAALRRRDWGQQQPFMLYADEYHRFATPAFSTLINEARKYGIATTIAHQYRDQLSPGTQRVTPLTSVNLIVFAVHGEDAQELSKQFDATPPEPQVIGYKPRHVPAQQPLRFLQTHGHESEKVALYVQILTDMLNEVDEAIPLERDLVRLRRAERLPSAAESYLSDRMRRLQTDLPTLPALRMGTYPLLKTPRFHWEFALKTLGDMLEASPIYTTGGETDPIYDQPRTYADMQAEIANELVSLPDYRAKVRLATGRGITEHVLVVGLWPEQPRACTPLPAGRPRGDVETQIAARTSAEPAVVLTEEAPPQRQQTTKRRRIFD